jgi:(1->4)-alpha-D-glucan 1-alpha-D-glucosylmutase
MPNNELRHLWQLTGIRPVVTVDGTPETALNQEEWQALMTAWDDLPGQGSIEQAVAALRRQHWQRILPPVLVRDEEAGPIAVTLHLPKDILDQPLHWQLNEENGAVWQGTVQPVELEVLEGARLEGKHYVALRLPVEPRLPTGYHRLRVRHADDDATNTGGECVLIVTPSSCYTPPGLHNEARIWGLSVDLAAIRCRRNWGRGDLTDLLTLLSWAAENGAGTVAVSSLLTGPASEKEHISPGLPSDRCFPDPLFLDLEAIADFHESEEARVLVRSPAFQVRLALVRDTAVVDDQEVATLKEEVAEVLWRHFQHSHLNPETERGWEYRHFQEAGGQRLRAFALYETLRLDRRPANGDEADTASPPLPPYWSEEATAFADQRRERIEYHQYLQWQLELQLAEAGRRSMELGLKVGLTQTLPAGVAPHGFAVWYQPRLFGRGLIVHGCSEDDGGQPVGPPILPSSLAAMAYEPFIAMLRRNMRHAGALRLKAIDLLARQQWRLPTESGGRTLEVAPPDENLLAIIALGSVRNRCLVIGEHQGPLAAPFARKLIDRSILVCCPGSFARDQQGDWLASAAYPAQGVVMASRYDLCTLTGFWQGRDIALLVTHRSDFDDGARERAIIAGASDRAHLLVTLKRENLLPPGHDLDPSAIPNMTPTLIRAVHVFLARTPAKLFLVHLADLADLTAPDEQETMPGPHRYPLFRPKLPADLENMMASEPLQQMFREFCLERTIGVVRPSAPRADRQKHDSHALPRAFYRLQFNRDCTFLQAAALLPYLQELGISHCYASPYLMARPGSTHGYDIIDHGSLNPEIGTRKEYEEFVAALDHNHMAQILDMVPNHMGVGPDNRWWVDVLENGQASPYAAFFDINWQPREEGLKNRLLLPVLGDYFGVVLEEGNLRLDFLADRGSFFIACYEHRYPLAPTTYPTILGRDLQRLGTRLGSQHEGFLELQSLITSFADLPGREETDALHIEMRIRNKEVLKRLLARLCREVAEIGVFIEENVLFFNGEPGRPESFNPLESLLAMQAYRLAFWRVASDEINYRRFFDINDLAGIRMEQKEVFDQTHRLVLDLIATGKIDGLRIDHPDGLYSPEHYFRTLQTAVSGLSPETETLFSPEGSSIQERQAALPLYVVVEKILADFEQLPSTWMVHGTTGYDFSCLLNGLFVDQAAEGEMTGIYHRFIGREIDFAALAHDCKRLIIRTAMAGELNVLSDQLHRLAKRSRYTQDFTLNGLREALTEIVAFFPVYRTYCTGDCLDDSTRLSVELAVERAKARWQVEETSIYDFIGSVLLLEAAPQPDGRHDQATVDFVKKLQQYTGPVMAKGLEDTAFYIYNRLVSLNEVGSDPCCFGVSVAAFHAANRARFETWPAGMLTTSTHDSKRSEDVRARINVLSEMVPEWQQALDRWHRLNQGKKSTHGREAAPSNNDEYALYQNLLGVWPFEGLTTANGEVFRERFTTYMLKVIREAKVHTSWLNRNQAYEEAMTAFIARLLDQENRAFLDDFNAFQRQTAWFGMLNSLAQLLLKLTGPGIPDIYQGNETWRFCLVDPDNRRPVDFDRRMAMLAGIKEMVADTSAPLADRLAELLDHADDGRIKMYLLWQTLNWRRHHPDLFVHGAYVPLQAVGLAKEHLCGFARIHGDQVIIAVVPRLTARLLGCETGRMPIGHKVWGETALLLPSPLQGARLTNLLSGEDIGTPGDSGRLAVAELLRHFPVALLVGTCGVP